MSTPERDSRRALADALRDDAALLTDEWLDVLADRTEVRDVRLLPDSSLRDHIPELIRWVAQAVERPDSQVTNEAADILRQVALLRRKQGYGAREILEEFDALHDIVLERTVESLERADPPPGAGTSARIASEVARAVTRMASATLGSAAEGNDYEERDLARRSAEFVRMLHHEVKSPLAMARSLAETLGDPDRTDEERARDAGVLTGRLDRIAQLMDDLLVLVRMEEGRSEERRIPIRTVVEGIFGDFRDAARREGVRLEMEVEEDFEVDASRTEIVLSNLVSNGIRFRNEDREDRWVRVTATTGGSDPPERRITVEDNGVGIPDTFRDRVFERFARAHPQLSDGVGLGLWIARSVAERRGGRLWFESEEDEGSRFHLVFPGPPT